MTANPSGQKPEEQAPQENQSTVAGDSAYEQRRAAEHDAGVANGTVTPEEPPHPLSWG
ncbi:hypothetical protein BKA00_000535 [Actinomadura coerulea]|uniref:Uncharacterized protein n=1 Tax=Actinomadura coerulea TaxID=46159 RepID=A0A7X0FTW6_9ACTN|nr:hypothetical protein [Actinomadura coerulea]MBB6393621.1 hypothetical protein [Actinomadura coerulea]GGP91545.1 hypothetical protein GCM10010187_03650 [Actinomadura coerulea]